MQKKLTKKIVDALRPESEVYIICDTELDGFQLRVHPSGKKTFYAYYRVNGERRRPVVGEYGKVTVEQARAEAKKVIAEASLGRDPSVEKQKARQSMTLEEFTKLFMKDAKRRTKSRTVEENERRLRLHILPALGSRRINTITKGDISTLHQRLAEKRMVERDGAKVEVGGPLGANRVLSLLKAMFNKAIEWGILTDNPAEHARFFPEKSRERFLNAEELQRLAESFSWASEIETLENSEWKQDRIGKKRKALSRPTPWATAAIKLLLYTGARRNEILTLRWEYVDFENRCLRLPDSKTGAKIIRLNTPAVEVLQYLLQIRAEGSPWVVQGQIEGQSIINIQSAWERIRERAGLPDLRLHDLRHVHASMAVMGGVNLPVVAKLLGHATTRMTERYAHLADDPVQAASEQIGIALVEAMRGGAKVVEVEDVRSASATQASVVNK